MGAHLNTRRYPSTKTKEEILKQWDRDCETSLYESGHSYSGGIGMLSGMPVFKKKRFETECEAIDYIADNHDKWSEPLAVSYNDKYGTKWWLIGGWCSS